MKTSAKIFKALADETRLRIMALLANGELCVCDLMAVLNLPQSTVSRHLSYLKNTGWVLDRRQGTWMHYRLNRENTPLQQALLNVFQKELAALGNGRDDAAALAAYLATKKINCSC
ncbi:MAG: ArsR family transcriptional regulator [Deltaproteobacteria bacterium RIFOXYD12_FULL_50_9]|nr:MAG: ArsR family transcriptional regulator [Deltaproteobacteria bacterium RIFOXYD12_FULL_50_9]